MKWKTRRMKLEAGFKWSGFLWFPVCCNNEWRWLEKAQWASTLPYPSRFDRWWI